MKRNIKLYIKDIIEYMERAEEYVKTLDFKRNRYPAIPWRDMAGMRDKIIHSYFTVDLEAVWLVVTEEIPRLKPLLLKILDDLGTKG